MNNNGACDYCNNNNIEVINIEELYDFFEELFENFKLKADGERLISKIQGNWNLFKNIDTGNRVINYVIENIDTHFQNSEELIEFNDEILENVNYWNILKHQLRWERRYLTNIAYLTEDLGWDGFFESKIRIDQNIFFHRARLHNTLGKEAYNTDEMFCPPKEISTAGRANPRGIPYLYLSDNKNTILYEIRASYLDEVSVATFTVKPSITDEIYISDFTETPTLFHPNEITKKIKSTLLKQLISKDLSKPMRRYDSELDYIPTQFICEFIKVFTGVHGIKFRSSVHITGNNLVIFDQNIMECIEVEKVEISRLNINSRHKE
ncbi:RES family NAD+ phosphorylase [Elizabethkingia anophelis]|uniref:RES family NAD+ phosphorylase n=1 Tax=Elizabethkingia anophelis TaxID=1117645 RepID=UPI0021AB405C|nr:RES family NAD+ phosphorylase [Elizabethkingia anophelis]